MADIHLREDGDLNEMVAEVKWPEGESDQASAVHCLEQGISLGMSG